MKSLRTYKAARRESGFTLVEIAIVLVIIGIILAGALKGNELIRNAKAKAIDMEVNKVMAAMNAYIDRYGALPGDDAHAVDHLGASATNGNGDGLIDGTIDWSTGALTGESLAFFRHLSLSGLLSQAPRGNVMPSQVGSGFMAIVRNPWGLGASRYGLCFNNVPGVIARYYESAFDDGFMDGGRAVSWYPSDNPSRAYTSATDGNVYSICVRFD